MRGKSIIRVIALGVLASACTGGSTPPTASPSVGSSTAVVQLQSGGCGSTPGQTGSRIAWMPGPQAVNTPHVLASPPAAAAILAGYPLRAGHPQSPSNKVAWAVRIPRNG